MAKRVSKNGEPKVGYFIQSRGPGGIVEFEEVYVYGPTRRHDEGIVGHDLRMRPTRLGPGDYTFVASPDNVEWTRPVSTPAKRSNAQIKREVDQILTGTSGSRAPGSRRSHATKKSVSPVQLTSEILVTRMIGRRVKSDWHRLIDGEIIQWEPFGAGGTDVLVKDVASGHLAWYASHGLTPIDGKGPLPSRSEVRRIREAEMEVSMKKIGERWEKEPPPPRIRR